MKNIITLLFSLFLFLLFWIPLCSQSQLGTDIDGEAPGDLSGYSVSLSADGNRMAIGALYNSGNQNDSGHARVYSWDGAAWVQLGTDIDGEAAGDFSGSSVFLSPDGNRLAVDGHLNDGNGNNAGHVRVYGWNGADWVQLGTDIDGEAADDHSGISVSLSFDGSRLAVGGHLNDGNGNNAGHVRVYDWNGTNWIQLGTDIDAEAAADLAGWSLSLSYDGSRLAIGAIGNDGEEGGQGRGHVRVYGWNGITWTQLGVDIDGPAALGSFGWSVSLSADGNRLAASAPYHLGIKNEKGMVRVYEWDGTNWAQLGADIEGTAILERLGSSLSLSADGNYMAAGAPYVDGNGLNVGIVRVYRWNGIAWIQPGAIIYGEAAHNLSGWSVSLSADGSRLAIGAPHNSDNGGTAGHVRVYSLPISFPADACVDSHDITPLFGQAQNVPQTSGLYNNTNYASVNDPTTGIDCFYQEDELTNTIWYSFIGDGNTYRIRTVPCNATNYIANGNTQMAIYTGDCGNLIPLACAEDEDSMNDLLNAAAELTTTPGTTYYILIDGWNGSMGEFCVEVTNLMPNSVTDVEVPDISLFPNPTSGMAALRGVQPRILKVMDKLGRVVLLQEGSNPQINLSHLPDGVYTLLIGSSDGSWSSSYIVKQ